MGPPQLPEDADCFEIFLTFWQGFFWLITCAYCCTSCASPERSAHRDAARRAARYDSGSSEEGFARRPAPTPGPPPPPSQFGGTYHQQYPPHPQSVYPPQQQMPYGYPPQQQGPPPQSMYAPSKDSRNGGSVRDQGREREREREHRKKRTQEDEDVEKALRESAREAEASQTQRTGGPPTRTDTNITTSDVQSPPPYRW